MDEIRQDTNVNEEATEEQERITKENEAYEQMYSLALEKLSSYGLEWTFRSIDYILNKENVSFGQLRSCVYQQGKQAVLNYLKSTIYLIKAGLIGSKQFKPEETEKLDNRAFEIMEDWRNAGFYTGTLHLMIINQMETKHFFMGSPDQGVMRHLVQKNLQKDLVKVMAADQKEQVTRQAMALSQTL